MKGKNLVVASAIALASNGCMFYGKQGLLGHFDAQHDGVQPGTNEIILCAEDEKDTEKRKQIIKNKVDALLKDSAECPSRSITPNPNGPVVFVSKGGKMAENTDTLCQNYFIVRGDCIAEK